MTSALILAGGLGTRLRSAVPDVPKPMAPIGQKPFLEHLFDYWIQQGIDRFVLSVGYKHEMIVEHFGQRYRTAKLEYVIEETPLGTGGGLLLGIEKMDKPFLLLNGDTYFAIDLKKLIEFAAKNKADLCFSLFRTHEEGRYMGMDVSPTGHILSLKSTNQAERLANGGVYWIDPSVFLNEGFSPKDKLSLEEDIFPALLHSGKNLMGIEFSDVFIDIGVPDDYHRAPNLLAP